MLIQMERKSAKPIVSVPLEKQIEELRSELALKDARINQLAEENLSNVATLLEQDMRLMDLEIALGV